MVPHTTTRFDLSLDARVFILLLACLVCAPSVHNDALAAENTDKDERIFDSGELRKLSLVEAIQLALEHNLGLQVQRVSQGKAYLDPIIAEAAFNPA